VSEWAAARACALLALGPAVAEGKRGRLVKTIVFVKTIVILPSG